MGNCAHGLFTTISGDFTTIPLISLWSSATSGLADVIPRRGLLTFWLHSLLLPISLALWHTPSGRIPKRTESGIRLTTALTTGQDRNTSDVIDTKLHLNV